MHDSIFLISNESKSNFGTGFVIDSDANGSYVATCGHVINNCGASILVHGKESEVIKNEYDSGLDLGILYVKGLSAKPLQLAQNKKTGSYTSVIGYSKLSGSIKKEPINDIEIKYDIKFSLPNEISAVKLYPKEPITNGYSGSPVICQNSNEVVGIVIIQVGNNTNYAICADHLRALHDFQVTDEKVAANIQQKRIEVSTSIKEENYLYIKRQFKNNFDNSLQSFSTQPKIWIEPRLHTKAEDTNLLSDKDTKIEIEDLLSAPKSIVIRARQQYGLSCLAHHLIYEAWVMSRPCFWLYIDITELKPHINWIEKFVNKKLKSLGLSREDIGCIVLDEFSCGVKNGNDILCKVSQIYYDVPVILMMTLSETPLLNESIETKNARKFEALHLWALPRKDIRKIISRYNDERYIGEENSVVNKIVSDLEVLNIPRTALNCLTILKIYEVEFDDSPVNRTEMIRRVLSLLFNVDQIPNYKTRPDLKDTEYVLGYFCEVMLKSKNYYFSREEFLKQLNNFCKQKEIDLDVDVIFDVLSANCIIVMRGSQFCFKFSYWIFYFAAHRMHHNPEFANYILNDMNYAAYPELIEFYTGIDRRRDDALSILVKDIKATREVVNSKCGLPDDFNIYNLARWDYSQDEVEKIHNDVCDSVQSSKLPDAVKDEYADKFYDRTRPHKQSIQSILEEYSLLRLMRSIRAGSMALRNSDYSTPSERHKLLQEILLGWEQVIKVLIVISPILSQKGYASFEGASFMLKGEFGKSADEKFFTILQLIPSNVVCWYKDDLFSKKMGPLLYKHIDGQSNELVKHALNLLIVRKRPKGWAKYIENYIISENKNSFYLLDVYLSLHAEYQYSFASNSSLIDMKKLIKMTVAKHEYGMRKPNQKAIKGVSDKILPERDEDTI